jgi:hypothetical protein
LKNKRKKQPQNQNRVTGLIILAVIVFMVFIQRTNLEWVKNWWAFLFLIPAIASMNTALSEIQNKKGFSFSLASNIVGVVFPIAICLIFLFSLGWNSSIPIIILLSGLSLFMLGFVKDSIGTRNIINVLRPWFFSWGLAVMIIGIIIFFNNLIILRWFGISLLIAASGGLVSAWISFRENSKIKFVTIAHLVTAFVIALPGILAIIR